MVIIILYLYCGSSVLTAVRPNTPRKGIAVHFCYSGRCEKSAWGPVCLVGRNHAVLTRGLLYRISNPCARDKEQKSATSPGFFPFPAKQHPQLPECFRVDGIRQDHDTAWPMFPALPPPFPDSRAA